MAVPVLDCYCLAKAREDARSRKNISGTFMSDILTSTLCMPCVIIQTYNEYNTSSLGESMERV